MPIWGEAGKEGCLPGKWEEGPGFTRSQLQFCFVPSQFLALPPPPKAWSKFLLPLILDAPNKVSDGSRTDVSDVPPHKQTPSSCVMGAVTLVPSSVFAILSYPCVSPALGLKSSLEPHFSHYSPSQAPTSVNGEWTDVCLTYQLRIALIPF